MNPLTPIAALEPGHPLLDPPTRAVLVMALLAFVLLGLGLIAGALIGGRWVRRHGGDDLTKPLPLNKPVHDYEASTSLQGPHTAASSDTLADARASGETRRQSS